MFGMGMTEIMLILAVALIVVGPKKLPDLAKTIGRAMGEFKNATRDFKRSIDLDDDLKDVKDSLHNMRDIPTYDPDKSAYTEPESARPGPDAAAEPATGASRAETTDPEKPTPDPEADQTASPGAKPHG